MKIKTKVRAGLLVSRCGGRCGGTTSGDTYLA